MKPVILGLTLTLGLLLINWIEVEAKCHCVCVDNEKQWVCTNSWDIPRGWCGGGWCSK